MPYNFSRDVDLSVERGAVYGGLAGAVVLLANLVVPAIGGVLAVPVFGIIIWVVFRDVWVVLSWGLLVAVIPLLFWVFVFFGAEATAGAYLIGVVLFFVFLGLPGFFHENSEVFLAYTVGGLFLAVIVGSVIVFVSPFEFGFPEVFGDVELIELYLDVSGLAMLAFTGFPVFGACYGAGLALLHREEVEGDV